MKNRKSVLVVDDDDAHRTMLRALVGGWGYDIIEADDGSIAIEKVQEQPFDLILMDVRMLKVSAPVKATELVWQVNVPVVIVQLPPTVMLEPSVSFPPPESVASK